MFLVLFNVIPFPSSLSKLKPEIVVPDAELPFMKNIVFSKLLSEPLIVVPELLIIFNFFVYC